jgi:uncharacterized protein YPO0396
MAPLMASLFASLFPEAATKQDINQLGKAIMSELQDTVDAITAQVVKAKDEIVNEINNLEAKVAAGETPDLTALKEAVQGLDDLNPDQPAE